jgi:predicted nucleic acid-binding protein
VPIYVPEPLSERCEELARAHGTPTIGDLCTLELQSALSRKVRRGELARPSAERIKTLFLSHVEQGIYRVLPLGRREIRLASGWVGQVGSTLRSLDALHLASAAAHELAFATADLALAREAGALGLESVVVR